jgi:cell division protein FtsA|tara:strand:- start:623 stop:1822 length:1200 start_codon:yes stop_codon:yes gene_type:complete
MQINKPHLFIELNDLKYIFLAVKYNEDFNFEILSTLIFESEGIKDGKIIDAEIVIKNIKKNLNIIEKSIGFTFKEATIISTQISLDCRNVSGYIKLSGAQIQEEDITYIINNIKNKITETEKNKTLIHLFNTNFSLDKLDLKNLPIGLHGQFYSHHLTFFLLPEIEIKNLKLVFKRCDLNIKRIVHKNFVNGINLINNYKNEILFASIKLGKNSSNISIFKNDSFVYSQNFDFGTNIIVKDLSKICSLTSETVNNIIADLCFDDIKKNNSNEYLDKKYFDEVYRKISLDHIHNIAEARIEEIINVIFLKNINIKYFINKIKTMHISIVDRSFEKNFKITFKKQLKDIYYVCIEELNNDEDLKSSLTTAELIGKGWSKEAIPIIQTKESIISRIFSRFFA